MRDRDAYARRFPLSVALLLTPDDRAASRLAIIRGAIWLEERGVADPLPPYLRKRLLRGKSGGQRTWIAVGLGLYRLIRLRPLLPFAAVGVLLLSAVSVARHFLG